jgi:hypothetical protein
LAIALPAAIEADREAWCQLDSASRIRAAMNPVIFLDFHFHDADWWSAAVSDNIRDLSAQGIGFPDQLATDLASEALMLAWTAAREDLQTASLLIGMSRQVSQCIASLTPRDINRIVSRFGSDIRLRWQSSKLFWRSLLVSAMCADLATMREVHLYSLQLLGGELLEGLYRPAQRSRG